METIKMEIITGRTGSFRIGNCLIITYTLPSGNLILLDSGAKSYDPLPAYLDERGIRVTGVIHTHLHEDHIANDRLLQQRYGADLYASVSEIRSSADPERVLRELGLAGWMGENYREMTAPLVFTSFPDRENTLTIEDCPFRLVPLPGHSTGHTGIITPDGVFCVGDALLSDFSLENARAPFELDMSKAMDSIRRIRREDCPYFAVSHRQVVKQSEIRRLADQNIRRLGELCAETASLVEDGMTEEELVDIAAAAREIHRDYRNVFFDIYIAIREELEYEIRLGRIRAEGEGPGRRLFRVQPRG